MQLWGVGIVSAPLTAHAEPLFQDMMKHRGMYLRNLARLVNVTKGTTGEGRGINLLITFHALSALIWRFFKKYRNHKPHIKFFPNFCTGSRDQESSQMRIFSVLSFRVPTDDSRHSHYRLRIRLTLEQGNAGQWTLPLPRRDDLRSFAIPPIFGNVYIFSDIYFPLQ